MSTIQQDILSEFFEKLSESEEFDLDRLERLRRMLTAQRRPKPATLVEILSVDSNDEVL